MPTAEVPSSNSTNFYFATDILLLLRCVYGPSNLKCHTALKATCNIISGKKYENECALLIAHSVL